MNLLSLQCSLLDYRLKNYLTFLLINFYRVYKNELHKINKIIENSNTMLEDMFEIFILAKINLHYNYL